MNDIEVIAMAIITYIPLALLICGGIMANEVKFNI